jgi:hypothetical protein
VPIIAEIMPTKWTYEALMVSQFKDNKYDELVYNWDKQISIARFNRIRRLPALRDALNTTNLAYKKEELSIDNPVKLHLLRNEFVKLSNTEGLPQFPEIENLNPTDFNHFVAEKAYNFIEEIDDIYFRSSKSASKLKDNFKTDNWDILYQYKDKFHNVMISDIVRKVYEKKKILEYRDNLIQNWELVYLDPPFEGMFKFRSHFFAPTKTAFGIRFDTFTFNILVVWFMALILYLTLYFDLPHKWVTIFNRK